MDYFNSASPFILLGLTAFGGYLGKQLGISRSNERELFGKNADLRVANAEMQGEIKVLNERSLHAVYKGDSIFGSTAPNS